MQQSAVAGAPPSAPAVSLALIVALALERRCLGKSDGVDGARIVVVQSGQGAANARRAAQLAITDGARALLSVGVAGALSQSLRTGDVVVPAVITDARTAERFESAPQWSESLRSEARAFAAVHAGVLVSVANAVESVGDKAAAERRYGAIACDMESAAIAAVAKAAHVPFAALRVVSDTATDELPQGVSEWVDAAGNARIVPVLGAMLAPGGWRSVVTMTRKFRVAQRRLRQLGATLSAKAYCCP